MTGLVVTILGGTLLLWFGHGWLRFLADGAGLVVGMVVGLVAGKLQSASEDFALPAVALLVLGAPCGLLAAEQLLGYLDLASATWREGLMIGLYFLLHGGLFFLAILGAYVEGEGLQTVRTKPRFFVGAVPGFFVGEAAVYALSRAIVF